MRTIFASVDLSLWGGLLFHPVFGGDKPQMLVKRITSSVMSNDSQSGCVPSGGKSFSHWLLLRTLSRLRLNSVCLCWLSEVASSGKGWYVFRSFLNAAPPSLITRFRNFSPLLFSMELAKGDVGGLSMATHVETLIFSFSGAQAMSCLFSLRIWITLELSQRFYSISSHFQHSIKYITLQSN